MNTHPLIALPAAGFYFAIGAGGSALVFNKLSHLAEYTLNKAFGDYQHPVKTRCGRIVVSTPIGKDYYYSQNIGLALAVAAIPFTGIHQILTLTGNSKITTASFFVNNVVCPILMGSAVFPIFLGLYNMILRASGGHHGRWVQIHDDEIKKLKIDKDNVNELQWGVQGYSRFGSSPEYFPGRLSG